MNFVFDVDGTLSPSRGSMDPLFAQWFLEWSRHRPVWVITGSDYAKTVEQLGKMLVENITGVYNCAGNIYTAGGVEQHRREFTLDPEVEEYLKELLRTSAYKYRTAQHIEHRGGLVNFSILGRGADREQREHYHIWDTLNHERSKLAVLIEQRFPELSAVVAGETGIDIYPQGWDKSQIREAVNPFIFFGDRCAPGGNDHSIALVADRVHAVRDWTETWQILRDQYSE